MEIAAPGIDGLERAVRDAATVAADGTSLQERIAGVEIHRPPTHADERGTITEIYDLRWGFTDDPLVYVYHVTVTLARPRAGSCIASRPTGCSSTAGFSGSCCTTRARTPRAIAN